MEIQSDNATIGRLLNQLAARAGQAAQTSAPWTLAWREDGLALLRDSQLIKRFDAPVRAGDVLAFLARQRAPALADTLPESLTFGPYVFWPRRAALQIDGREDIMLTDKERDLIAALWQAPDRALERDALLDAVWAYASNAETHTLETHIYRLRRKIEQDPARPRWLVNEDGRYRLNIA